jgi:5-methylcytosine-specific restriction endonuclease McrA
MQCVCSFCDKDFSETKNAVSNRTKHEVRMHKEEYEKRKQTTHECLECSKVVPYGKLFCGRPCRQRAKAVRYIRSVTKRKVQNRKDIKNAISEKILWAFHGGYVALPASVVDAVWDRDNDACVECGVQLIRDRTLVLIDADRLSTLGQVDHPQNSHSIDDAKLLCWKCHRIKTLFNRRKLDPNDSGDAEYLQYVEKVYEDARTSTQPQHVPNWDYLTVRRNRRRPKEVKE